MAGYQQDDELERLMRESMGSGEMPDYASPDRYGAMLAPTPDPMGATAPDAEVDDMIGRLAGRSLEPSPPPRASYTPGPEGYSKQQDMAGQQGAPQFDDAEARSAWKRDSILSAIAAAFSPRAGERAASRRDAAYQGRVKSYQDAYNRMLGGQRLAQAAGREDRLRAKDEFGREATGRRLDQGERRVQQGDRRLDISENNLDPTGEWAAARNAERDRQAEEAQRRRLERDEFTGNTAEGKARRGVVASGNQQLMRQEGILSPVAPNRAITNNAEAQADLYRATFEELRDGEPLTPEEEAIIQRYADPRIGNTERTRFESAIKERLDNLRATTATAAEDIADKRVQREIPQTLATIDTALETIESNRGPDGDIPGLSRFDRAAPEIPVIGGAVDTVNRLVEGGAGSDVRTALEDLRSQLVKYRSGAAATDKERATLGRILAMDWQNDSDSILRAIRRWRDNVQQADEAIIQGHGLEGARIMGNRRPATRGAANRLRNDGPAEQGNRRVGPAPGRHPAQNGRTIEVAPDGRWRYVD